MVEMNRLLLGFAALGLGGCAFLPSDVALSPGARDCSAIAGLNDLHIYIRSDGKERNLGFNGSAKVQASIGEPVSGRNWRNNAKLNFTDFDGEKFREAFPRETASIGINEHLGFPANYSPDGRHFASAVITVDPAAARITNWGASTVPKKLIFRSGVRTHSVKSLPSFSFYALAWEPNSGRIAVVETNYDRTPRSPLAAITPDGGVVYSDVVLSVYEVSGTLACQSLLASKVPDVSISVEWRRDRSPV